MSTRIGRRVFLLCMVLALPARAQEQVFRLTLTGASGSMYPLSAVVPTADGGAACVGTSGGARALRVAGDGSIQWEHLYLVTNGAAAFEAIARTSDGGFLALGHVSNGGPPCSILLIRLRSDGSVLWSQQYESPGFPSGVRVGRAVGELANGDILVAAHEASEVIVDTRVVHVDPRYWFFRTDADGIPLWGRSHSHVDWLDFEVDWGDWAAIDPDGAAVLGGNLRPRGASTSTAWILALDAVGASVWQGTVEAPAPVKLGRVALAPDRSVLVTAGCEDLQVAWLARFTASGDLLWQRQRDWGLEEAGLASLGSNGIAVGFNGNYHDVLARFSLDGDLVSQSLLWPEMLTQLAWDPVTGLWGAGARLWWNGSSFDQHGILRKIDVSGAIDGSCAPPDGSNLPRPAFWSFTRTSVAAIDAMPIVVVASTPSESPVVLSGSVTCLALGCSESPDSDGDTVADACDNCVATPNASQIDSDADGIGDACSVPSVREPSALDRDSTVPPLLVTKGTAPDTVDVSWEDVGAPTYHVHGGNIGDLAAPLISEQVQCALTTNAGTVGAAGAGRWILALAAVGRAQSSLGRDSFGGERATPAAPCP